MAALIPFAVDKETGAMREVGDVPRGRKCGCICPSCKAGLVARQGGENEWHFAHDYRAAQRPDRKCDISFESACRLFAIDLLKAGRIPLIKTPVLESVVVGSVARIRPGTSLVGLTFVDSQEYGDVKAEIEGYVLEVFMDYPGRVPPEEPERPETTGLLAFPVSLVKRRYQEVRGGPQVLAGIVAGIFSEAGGGKRWLYHPAVKIAYRLSGISEIQHSVKHIRSERVALQGLEWTQRYEFISGVGLPLAIDPGQVADRRDRDHGADPRGSYKCFRCRHCWQGGEVTGRTCPHCGSDRHSVFSPL